MFLCLTTLGWKMSFSMELEIPLCGDLGMVSSNSVVLLRLWKSHCLLASPCHASPSYCEELSLFWLEPGHLTVLCILPLQVHSANSCSSCLPYLQVLFCRVAPQPSGHQPVTNLWGFCDSGVGLLYLFILIYFKHCYQSFAPPCNSFTRWLPSTSSNASLHITYKCVYVGPSSNIVGFRFGGTDEVFSERAI